MGKSPFPFISQSEARVWGVCFGVMALTLAFDLATPSGVASGIPYIAVVLISLWSKVRWFTAGVAFVCSIFTAVEMGDHAVAADPMIEILNRTLQIFAIWTAGLLGISRKQIDRRWEEALVERESALRHLKVLHGMLPICASCKKIRDDQGYWNMLETYIDEHSEAHFTHGICPDCRTQLYGSLDQPATTSRRSKEPPLVWHGPPEEEPRARMAK